MIPKPLSKPFQSGLDSGIQGPKNYEYPQKPATEDLTFARSSKRKKRIGSSSDRSGTKIRQSNSGTKIPLHPKRSTARKGSIVSGFTGRNEKALRRAIQRNTGRTGGLAQLVRALP